jgi:hypothetical protein
VDDLPEWAECQIRIACREWLDSDEGLPDGGSGPGLCYIQEDMEAAYRAGYLKCQADQ